MSKTKDWQPDNWTTWEDETYKHIKEELINKIKRIIERGNTPKIPQALIFYRTDIKERFKRQLKNRPIEKNKMASGYTNALKDMINKKIIKRVKKSKGIYTVVPNSKLYDEIIKEIPTEPKTT